jgi:hypothetical protein
MSNSVEAYHRPISHKLHQQMGELLVVVEPGLSGLAEGFG